MNKGTDRHIPEDVLERFAMGTLSGEECESVEDHLLLCPVCQQCMEETLDYLAVIQAATALAAPDSPHSIPVRIADLLKLLRNATAGTPASPSNAA